jgi:hypothetical protein
MDQPGSSGKATPVAAGDRGAGVFVHEGVKILDGRAIADDYCGHVTAFGFPNRAANRACEASDQLFIAAAQIECTP